MLVVVIEDSRTQAHRLRLVLERQGFAVRVAFDGLAGVALAIETVPDVVLSDVVMPGCDGFEVCRRLRADERTRNVPVMLLTARGTPSDVLRALAAGADSFVTKPYEDEQLVARLNRIGDPARTGAVMVDGEVLRIDATPRQMTEVLICALEDSARAEAVIREREERFRSVQEASLDGFMIFKSVRDDGGAVTDFEFLYVNPAAEGIVGRDANDLLGKRLLTELPTNRDSGLFDRYLHVVETGEPLRIEQYYRGEGLDHWLRITAVKLADGFTVSFADITDRRRAEMALAFLAEASATLASSLDYETTLARVAELAVPRIADLCGVYVRDDDGILRQVAVAAADTLRGDALRAIHATEGPGASVLEDMPVIRTGRPDLVTEVTDASLEAVSESPAKLAALRALGMTSWLVVPLAVHERGFGVLSLSMCDSGRRYTEADLPLAEEIARRAAAAVDNARLYANAQRDRDRIEEANRAKDEFLAIVSHELRTPLTAMLGWTRMLRTGRLEPDKRDKALESVERNARAQAQLVEDLLDISRIITGKMRLDVRTVDLVSVIEASVDVAKPGADAKGIAIHVEIDPVAASVNGDPDRLQQVAWNLLTNAVKFTPRGGRIDVMLKRGDGTADLVVADNGQGIARDFVPHVFERFRQADGSITRKAGGLGLGLAIVKHLVELHGGTIRAESEGEGRGARFTVRLPLGTARAAMPVRRTIPEPSTVRAPFQCPPELAGKRVLVVEDEPDARELLVAVLESCNVRVTSTRNADEAFRAYVNERPDAVVSDVGMPGEDGYSLLRRIRAHGPEDQPRVPAVALTALARNEDRAHAIAAGFDEHLAKPIDPSALVQTLVRITGARVGGT